MGRVIARPLSERRVILREPPGAMTFLWSRQKETMLDQLKESGYEVLAVGKITTSLRDGNHGVCPDPG